LRFNYFIPMTIASAMLLQYRTHLSPYTPCTTSTSVRSALFSYSHLWSPLHRLLYVRTRGVMKFWDWTHTNPRRNTSKKTLEALPSGNKAETLLPLCCCFVALLLPLPLILRRIAETKLQHVAVCTTLIFNEDTNCHDRETVPICFDSI
jgi:hypothetical protein